MPSTFTIHEVASGVWAAVAPDTAGPAVSNSAIIDLGDKTIVVDTFMTVAAAEELATEVRRLTGRGAFLVVNSHWHADHVRGNQVFAGAPIVGTRRMNELIAADAAQAAEDDEYRLTLPDLLIDGRLDIEGERALSILSYGRGHTEVDLFVHLPDDGIVVAGDLVWVGAHPKTEDGFPADWAAVVDRIAAMRPRHVIPGHGPPGTATDVEVMAGYLREIDAMVVAARAGDLDAGRADPPVGSEEWQDIARFRRSLAKLAGAAE